MEHSNSFLEHHFSSTHVLQNDLERFQIKIKLTSSIFSSSLTLKMFSKIRIFDKNSIFGLNLKRKWASWDYKLYKLLMRINPILIWFSTDRVQMLKRDQALFQFIFGIIHSYQCWSILSTVIRLSQTKK